MPEYTQWQQVALAIIPKFSGALSLFG